MQLLNSTALGWSHFGWPGVAGGVPPAPAFSPSSLYSSGSQGIWLDPSDLTTMFSDRAGTTPVTTPGTVVGLRLDKSKGLALGSELVVNGDFATDSNWTKSGGVTISGGTANFAGVSDGAGIYQTASFTVGRFYRVTYTATISVGSISCWVGGFGAARNTSGTYSETIIAGSTNAWVGVFSRTSGTNATIDNISVRELAGNHAVAPTDAARPIYGVEPKGGRRNLLTYSEQMDSAIWQKIAGTVGGTAETADPLGGNTADKLTHASAINIAQDVAGVSGDVRTFSCYLKKSGTQSTCELYIYKLAIGFVVSFAFNFDTGLATLTQGSGSATMQPIGATGWYRCSVTGTLNASTGYSHGVYNAAAVYAWGAQLELGSTSTNYQKVTTAYDITESGVATCHYVQYDGSDDSMSTSAIDFTGTDKMSVFAGVRKLSDAAVAQVVGTRGASAANVFEVLAPSGTGSNFYFASTGTSTSVAEAIAAAPVTRVLTGLGDIAGDRATLRLNGTQAAQSTSDQGTGNYGNYPLFIGRRNNATLPFNGKDYGIIVVGKAASAGEITDTETWLAAKTAQVTL